MDFEMNIMCYAPGAHFWCVETHVMEHGMVMLQGQALQLLGRDWHEIWTDDFVWMGPYVPQQIYATGNEVCEYLLYKDVQPRRDLSGPPPGGAVAVCAWIRGAEPLYRPPPRRPGWGSPRPAAERFFRVYTREVRPQPIGGGPQAPRASEVRRVPEDGEEDRRLHQAADSGGQGQSFPARGPALGQRGLNIMQFVKEFNAATQGMEPGMPTPVVITAFADRTFTFITKTPPNTYFLKKAASSRRAARPRARAARSAG